MVEKKRIATAIIAVVLITAITLVTTSFLLAQRPIVAVGDYVEYKVITTTNYGSNTGSVRFEVKEATTMSYTVTITGNNISVLTPQATRYISTPIGLLPDKELQMVGEQTISTVYGTRTVLHYTGTTISEYSGASFENDYYVDKETGITLLAIAKSSTVTYEFSISSTNVRGL